LNWQFRHHISTLRFVIWLEHETEVSENPFHIADEGVVTNGNTTSMPDVSRLGYKARAAEVLGAAPSMVVHAVPLPRMPCTIPKVADFLTRFSGFFYG